MPQWATTPTLMQPLMSVVTLRAIMVLSRILLVDAADQRSLLCEDCLSGIRNASLTCQPTLHWPHIQHTRLVLSWLHPLITYHLLHAVILHSMKFSVILLVSSVKPHLQTQTHLPTCKFTQKYNIWLTLQYPMYTYDCICWRHPIHCLSIYCPIYLTVCW